VHNVTEANAAPLRVLMVTCEWPDADSPHHVPFIVRQVNFLRRAGVDIDVFSFRGARNPLNYARAWARARRRLHRGTYDLIHAQWGQSAPTVLPTRLPLVVTFRGGEGEGIVGDDGRYTVSGEVLRLVSSYVARRADELVVVSAHMREYLPNRRTHVIPSGLDFSRFPLMPKEDARRQLGLPQDKRLVLFAGNPDEARKRHPLAAQVVARLPTDAAAELVVMWRVPHDRVPLYMNACDALLFVSMYEGSPNVVKEALACNLPVVSVAVGDVGERLDGVAGCTVCETSDPDRLAMALAGTLRRGQRCDGRSAVQNLNEETLAQRMIDIYRLAIDGRRRSSINTAPKVLAPGATPRT
jgi:glycosyltransferase involved in cell wall biosynthesis